MDPEMIRLSASVEKYGIINPLIVRPIPDGVYEIISGHRRKAAAEKFGYRKVPVIIRVMSDDEAVINMVDSNLQRQQITFSEKAFAYKMKNEAMKRTGGRRKSSQSDYPLKGKKTVEIIGEEFGDSAKQVQRYLKLTDLIPELLEKLDNGELSFNPAVELSYLTIEEQKEFIDAMERLQMKLRHIWIGLLMFMSNYMASILNQQIHWETASTSSSKPPISKQELMLPFSSMNTTLLSSTPGKLLSMRVAQTYIEAFLPF